MKYMFFSDPSLNGKYIFLKINLKFRFLLKIDILICSLSAPLHVSDKWSNPRFMHIQVDHLSAKDSNVACKSSSRPTAKKASTEHVGSEVY